MNGTLPLMPYTEAIRKLVNDEWVYSTDQDFTDPEKFFWERVYTADQMRAYAAAAVAAEREACARVREEADSIIERLQNRIALQEAVMRQALGALEDERYVSRYSQIVDAIAALSKALEGK